MMMMMMMMMMIVMLMMMTTMTSVKVDERYPALHDVDSNCDVLRVISVTSTEQFRHLGSDIT